MLSVRLVNIYVTNQSFPTAFVYDLVISFSRHIYRVNYIYSANCMYMFLFLYCIKSTFAWRSIYLPQTLAYCFIHAAGEASSLWDHIIELSRWPFSSLSMRWEARRIEVVNNVGDLALHVMISIRIVPDMNYSEISVSYIPQNTHTVYCALFLLLYYQFRMQHVWRIHF